MPTGLRACTRCGVAASRQRCAASSALSIFIAGRDDGVVLHALVVVVDLLAATVCISRRSAVAAGRAFRARSAGARAAIARALRRTPTAAQEAVRALDAGVGPLERLLGRRGEHHEQARGVGAVLGRSAPADRRRCSWTCDIVPMPPYSTGWPSALSVAPIGLPLVVALDVDVGRVEVVDAALSPSRK